MPLIDELLRRASWTRRLARSLLAGDEDDAVQEAFLSALRRPPDLSRPLEPWLRTVVSHQAANRARHERRRRTREEQALLPAGPGSPEDGLAEREIHRLLAEAVAALPEPHREAVQLRYFDELSSPEIAARLGVPAGTVRSRVKAALEELGRALDRRAGGRGRWRPAVAVLLAGPPLPSGGVALAVGAPPARRALVGVIKALASAVALVALIAAVIAAWSGTRSASRGIPTAVRKPPPALPPPIRMVAAAAIEAPAAPVNPPTTVTTTATMAVAPPAPLSPAPFGTVAGTVTFEGLAPPPAPPDPGGCAARAGDELLVGPHRELANVVVRIVEGLRPGGPPPAGDVVVTQQGCAFIPRVQPVQVGQTVAIRNADQVLHRLRLQRGLVTWMDRAQPPGAAPVSVTVDGRGQVALECDVHPWTKGYLVVGDNTAAAVTGRDGHYALPPLPPGTYTVEAWHETLGRHHTAVRVAEGAVSEVDFSFRPSGTGCTIAVASGPIAAACREDGVRRAKVVMKELEKAGKARGLKRECDDCHQDESAGVWTLRAGGREELARLLELVSRP